MVAISLNVGVDPQACISWPRESANHEPRKLKLNPADETSRDYEILISYRSDMLGCS